MTITHEQIGQRAREIWEREGRPEGQDMSHWLQAEKELRLEASLDPAGRDAQPVKSPLLQVPAGLEKGDENRKRPSRRKPANLAASP